MGDLNSVLLSLLCLFVGAAANNLWNGRRVNRLESLTATLVANNDNLTKSVEEDRAHFNKHLEMHDAETRLLTKVLDQNNLLIQAITARKAG